MTRPASSNVGGASSVTVSVPGKVILAGEYDVLRGGTAIAATVAPRLSVTLAVAPADQGSTKICSDLWTAPCFLHRDDQVSFYGHSDILTGAVAAAIKTWNLPDLNVTVQSGFEISSGFGSSSALRLAILVAAKVLAHPDQQQDSMLDCARLAYSLQRVSQSSASGYDIATQLLGGVVEFACDTHTSSDHWPSKAKKHPEAALQRLNDFVHVFIGGRGAPTTSLMRSTKDWLDKDNLWQTLHAASTHLVTDLQSLLEAGIGDERERLAQTMKHAAEVRRFFAQSPAFPAELAAAFLDVPDLDRSWTWKATGAGGEDAILLFGSTTDIAAAAARLAEKGWHQQERLFSSDPMRIDAIIDACNQDLLVHDQDQKIIKAHSENHGT